MLTHVNISQTHLYHQFDAYLTHIGNIEGKPRENNLSVGGDCVGWSFLFGYYNNINKSQEFTDIQTYISSWDKNIASLYTSNGLSEPLKNKYGTGIKLFEQTLNDVVWFSQIKSKTVANNKLSQNDRIEQFDYAGDHQYKLNNIFSFLKNSHTNITLQELPDMLKIAQQWENSWLDLGIYSKVNNVEIGHALSIYINPNGAFTYFDSNASDKPLETHSPETISQKIFSALGNLELTLNDFSLYQFTHKNEAANTVNQISDAKVILNINKNVSEKFLAMSLENHQLDPIYKLLAIDAKNGPGLISAYETALFDAAIKQEHVGMTDLLIKHNPDLAPLQLSDLLPFSFFSIFFDNISPTLKSSSDITTPFIQENLINLNAFVDLIY